MKSAIFRIVLNAVFIMGLFCCGSLHAQEEGQADSSWSIRVCVNNDSFICKFTLGFPRSMEIIAHAAYKPGYVITGPVRYEDFMATIDSGAPRIITKTPYSTVCLDSRRI